jgi:hypothetical protein
VFDIEATLAKCVAGKIIAEETATDVLRDMAERSRSGSFVAVLSVFTVGALKR